MAEPYKLLIMTDSGCTVASFGESSQAVEALEIIESVGETSSSFDDVRVLPLFKIYN